MIAPKLVPHQRHVLAARLMVFGQEIAAHTRPDAQGLQESLGEVVDEHPRRLAGADQRASPPEAELEVDDPLETAVAPPRLQEVDLRKVSSARVRPFTSGDDRHESIGIGVGERTKEHPVGEREGRRGRADAESQREQGRGGEARTPPQRAQGVAKVLHRFVGPPPAPDGPGIFFDQTHVPEPPAGRQAGLLRRHPGLDAFPGFQFQVQPDLVFQRRLSLTTA